MPTSSAPKVKSRPWRIFWRIAATLAVFIVCDVLISYALVPYGTKSEVMWWEYRQTDELDTVILGDSLVQRGLDPEVIDSIAGTNSLNMATNGQEAVESYIALRQAIRDHDVDRVIYGLELSMLTKTPRAVHLSGFLTEKWKGGDASEVVGDLKYALRGDDFLSTPDSLNVLFPWVKQHCSFKDVPKNIKTRLDGLDPGQASSINDKDWEYIDKGFGGYARVFNPNTQKQKDYMNVYRPKEIRDENMAHLLEICKLCQDNGVELIAFAPPMPEFNLLAMKDVYDEFYGEIERELAKYGVRFYNFNLAKDELYENIETDFMDWEHLNLRGAKRFSESVGKLLVADAEGQDLGGYFYGLDERIDRIDTLSRVTLRLGSNADGAIEMRARSWTGPNTKVEYEFRARKKDKGTYDVIQPYSSSNTLTWTPPEKGAYEVRVYARVADEPVGYGKYHTKTIVL